MSAGTHHCCEDCAEEEALSIKIKGLNKIVARASGATPTRRASDYDVAWVSGLDARNSSDTTALCVTPHGKDPRTTGLHFTQEAALVFADALISEAAKAGGSVMVLNHKAGSESTWQTFADQDAVVLGSRIASLV